MNDHLLRPAGHDGNLARLLSGTAATYPERTAIVFGDERTSYAALDGAANRVANLWKKAS